LRYQKEKIDIVVGGALNKFDKARHFGEIIWAEYALESPKDFEYYENTSFKTDFNFFGKAAWTPVKALTIYGDLQYRTILYKGHGIESHQNPVAINETFQFFNPKLGITYQVKPGTLYASYSVAHREPIRDDYIDAGIGEKPRPEMLGNLEMGIRKTDQNFQYSFNFFLMNYRDQLVLTGEINDDGAYIRKNAGKSYRSGFEISAAYKPVRYFEIAGNLSLSVNKTDYRQADDENQIITYDNSTISFSPSVISGAQIRLFPVKNLEIDWLMKYVGKQYLDNTENESLTLDPYFIHDARIALLVTKQKLPDIEITFLINNIFNTLYESNGAVYGSDAYYYPQAGTNFMAGMNIKF
jgi:iron complex outermembrane receptor protein